MIFIVYAKRYEFEGEKFDARSVIPALIETIWLRAWFYMNTFREEPAFQPLSLSDRNHGSEPPSPLN